MNKSKWGALTPTTIVHIAWEVRDGEANPEDSRRLLKLFCDCFDQKKKMPNELIEHLRDAFDSFLKDERNIESALGLVRKKGKPKADEQVQMQMAAELLRFRLGGKSHQVALEEVAEKFGWSKTIVGEAWKKWWQEGITLLRLERPPDGYPWTPGEVQKMAKIFRNNKLFIAPE